MDPGNPSLVGLIAIVKRAIRVNDEPRDHREQERYRINAKQNVPTECVEQTRADVWLRGVPQAADVDEARRNADA